MAKKKTTTTTTDTTTNTTPISTTPISTNKTNSEPIKETTTPVVKEKKPRATKKKAEKLESIVTTTKPTKQKKAPVVTASAIISEEAEPIIPEPTAAEIAEIKKERMSEVAIHDKRIIVVDNPTINDPEVEAIIDEEDTISDVIDIESNSSRTKKYPYSRAENCFEVNEGIPIRPLPTKNLPQMHGVMEVEKEPESKPRSKNPIPNKPKKDGIEIAMEILDQYYEGTPAPDLRFRQHEE